MTEKRLFTVLYISELVVLAESQQDAKRIAWSHRTEGLELDSADPMLEFPSDWDEGSQPYGGDGRTLGELIAAGHAPDYVALKRRRDEALAGAKILYAQAKQGPGDAQGHSREYRCETCLSSVQLDTSVPWAQCPKCKSEDVFRLCPVCKDGSIGDEDDICTNPYCDKHDPSINESDRTP